MVLHMHIHLAHSLCDSVSAPSVELAELLPCTRSPCFSFSYYNCNTILADWVMHAISIARLSFYV
jgi:hypothetical protein